MGIKSDTRAATWARIAARARKDAARLAALGIVVTFPADFDVPPHRRIAVSITE